MRRHRVASGGKRRGAGAADEPGRGRRRSRAGRSGAGRVCCNRADGEGGAWCGLPGGGRAAQRGRGVNPEHSAERAQRAADLRCGGDQALHRRIVEQGLQLTRPERRLRRQPHQPGESARQPLSGRRDGLAARRGRARARRWQGTGSDAGGDPVHAEGHPPQPRPDQDDKRPGQPFPARSHHLAQRRDQAGETRGRGERRGRGHERKRNIGGAAWASGRFGETGCRQGGPPSFAVAAEGVVAGWPWTHQRRPVQPISNCHRNRVEGRSGFFRSIPA
jgi:hypothetical protein